MVNTLWVVCRFNVDKVCVRMCSRVIDILHMRSYKSGGELIRLLSLRKCAGCKGYMCFMKHYVFFFVKFEIDLKHVNVASWR